MAAELVADPRDAAVDEALKEWRQGDCVLGKQGFFHRFDLMHPLSDTAKEVAGSGDGDLVEEQVPGLVVLTQTCDIVRSCRARHFIEVCPLAQVPEDNLREIERGRRPSHGFLPLLAGQSLVADLDRTMTVEKAVVATWERTPGWRTDAEGRAFATALARKHARFAFPDAFTALVKKLQDRLMGKHDRSSPEGDALRQMREIRVHASPSWDAAQVTLTFLFVKREDDTTDGATLANYVDAWLKLVPKGGPFVDVSGYATTLEDMTAADYVGSDPLDLDHLSTRTGSP